MGLSLWLGPAAIACGRGTAPLRLYGGRGSYLLRIPFDRGGELPQGRNHQGEIRRGDAVLGGACKRRISGQRGRLRLDQWSFPRALAGTAQGDDRPIGQGAGGRTFLRPPVGISLRSY